jgi:ABC-type phosphate transport system substrate-binding protein
MRARTMIRNLVLAAVALACARPTSAGPDPFIVIVNPDNPIAEIDRDDLRDAYLKRTLQWARGKAIHPLDLAKQFPVRERFTRDVLRKTGPQLQRYWNQQIFTGKSSPPHVVSSTRDMIDLVLSQPGAIGYLPADVDPGKAKVVKVR